MLKTVIPEETRGLNRKLIRAFESMLSKNSFKLGQIVRWKQGLKNKSAPQYNQPAIVWEILAKPVFDTVRAQVATSPNFHEPLDIVLGVMDGDEFLLLHFDSRRFEPIPQ